MVVIVCVKRVINLFAKGGVKLYQGYSSQYG